MKTPLQQLLLEINEYKHPTNLNGTDYILIPLNKLEHLEEKFIALEKEQIKNAFCAGWDKSKVALMPNKKNYYSQEYLKTIQHGNK